MYLVIFNENSNWVIFFQKFHAEIRIKFNTSICILRSDNAKEYLFMPFSSFMSSHGISFILSLHSSTECIFQLIKSENSFSLNNNEPKTLPSHQKSDPNGAKDITMTSHTKIFLEP